MASAIGLNPIALVELVGIARHEAEAAQALQVRVRDHAFDEPLAQVEPAMLRIDENVAEVRVRGAVGHDARETHLARFAVETEAQRIVDGAGEDRLRDAGGPVALAREEGVDRREIEPGGIVGHHVVVTLPLHASNP